MSVADDYDLSEEDVTRLVGMAWDDDVPFEGIEQQFGVPEDDVIRLMRERLKRSSWELWRERVSGRPTKHAHRSRLSESTSRRPPNARSFAPDELPDDEDPDDKDVEDEDVSP